MMLNPTKEEQVFLIKVKENIRRVYENNIVKKTGFLTIREQMFVQELVNQYEGVSVIMSGGFKSAERKRAIIYHESMPYDLEDDIVGLKLSYAFKHITLTHPQILGSILGLNIKREIVGDIVIEEDGHVYIAVCQSFEPFFLQMFHKVGKNDVLVNRADVSQIVRVENYLEQEYIVSSFRLDVIVAALTKLSRSDVSELIKSGAITHQYITQQNHSKICQLQDVIAIRKYGRFKILREKATTKNQRYIVVIGKIIS